MAGQAISDSQLTHIDYICVAANLLEDMMSELHSLKANNRRLTLAMAAAGHDLRQRLHTLLATVELLMSTPDKVRMEELSQRAKSLIFRLAQETELLACEAEQEYTRAAPAAPRFLISSVLRQLRSDWGWEAAAKRLHFTVAHIDCVVESDQRLLASILNNLVGNAVRHTSQGGVSVESTREGRFLVLVVADTGPGISEDDLRRSFSFSSRSGGAKEGMGLGLSIARKTAEILGHELDVSTAQNSGTCARLYVPVSSQEIHNAPGA
jgi:signal transduction histidine kinase